MRSINVLVESKIKMTPRVKQLSGMFDAPINEKLSHRWTGELPIDERAWNVGLIVGPSGCGKSTLANRLFGEEKKLQWKMPSVCDDFGKSFGIEKIAETCSAVGFSTIPSWVKPYAVLSTGEKFRVEMARRLLEAEGELILVDEFTSVVDRQVAAIGSHAVQKYIRRAGGQFVAVSCHFDIVEWLQPDWIFEPATMTFQWRSLRRRPNLDVEVVRVDYKAWRLFAPFHYLTAELAHSAACYVLFVAGVPASFAGILHRPHSIAQDIKGFRGL